jgi:hypothetical protein
VQGHIVYHQRGGAGGVMDHESREKKQLFTFHGENITRFTVHSYK